MCVVCSFVFGEPVDGKFNFFLVILNIFIFLKWRFIIYEKIGKFWDKQCLAVMFEKFAKFYTQFWYLRQLSKFINWFAESAKRDYSY